MVEEQVEERPSYESESEDMNYDQNDYSEDVDQSQNEDEVAAERLAAMSVGATENQDSSSSEEEFDDDEEESQSSKVSQ